MKRVLLLGNNGMLGHAVEQIFSAEDGIELFTTSRTGTDATCKFDVLESKLEELIKRAEPEYVINCIGTIKPRINESLISSVQEAVQINANFPLRLYLALENSSVNIIQIATDCVYSGIKGSYVESDSHDPTDVYGKTKSLGEVKGKNFLNLRVSIVGPEKGRSTSLLEWFLNQPLNASLSGYANHFWNGITTYQFAKIALGIIRQPKFEAGNFHIVPSDKVSKLELLQIFRDVYFRNDILINETFPELINDRTLASECFEHNQKLWHDAGYLKIPTIRENIEEMKLLSENLR
jgi:dTDP-4-dehydrorhamnose reductase